MASSAMPVIFPYVNFRNSTFIDGGTMLNLDIGGAIERCKEIVPDESDIILDVVLCTGSHLKNVD